MTADNVYTVRINILRCTRDAAITSRPAPATDQHATGAQCNSGAYSGSFCRPPATAAIRAKVASASAENTSPVTLPSSPVSPIASAAEIADAGSSLREDHLLPQGEKENSAHVSAPCERSD
jgi:hypothetical protein